MVKVKKIIFLALSFPNAEENTIIWTDLVHEFHVQGHDILVVAPALNKTDTGLRLEAGVKVLRVATYKLFDVGPVLKGLANIMLPYQYKYALKKNNVKLDFDLILIPTPPITLGKTANWLKRKTKAKLYLILRDIFPQNAVDLKMISQGGLIHRYFRKKELKLYRISDKIGCMSQANIEYIKTHNPKIEASKLHLLPNWENLPKFEDLGNIDDIKAKYGLTNKFVVIFGGNIGRPQKMENIIELAKNCTEIKDLVFLIIGKGTEFKKLNDSVTSLKLFNVVLEKKIPKRDYYNLLKAADVGLISLSEEFTIPNFPSKVLSYFGSKKPVLASIDLQTDFGQMLVETNSGLWAEAGKTELLKEKLITLYKDKALRTQMGENGYDYMVSNLLPNHAYRTILNNT